MDIKCMGYCTTELLPETEEEALAQGWRQTDNFHVMDTRTQFYLENGWKVPLVAHIVGQIDDDEPGAMESLDVLDQRLSLVLARARTFGKPENILCKDTRDLLVAINDLHRE